MKSISCHRGYRGFYEVYDECLVVSVYKNGYPYNREFGFTINNRDEASVEYQFRLRVDNMVNQREPIYQDLKDRYSHNKNAA